VNLLKPRAGIQFTQNEIAALKVANENNHRRNTTLPKTNMNSKYRSEVRRDNTMLDQASDEKTVEINDFLKSRIDPTKLNIRMF
jgi:hypothetical protein